jgi:hypothetical protein
MVWPFILIKNNLIEIGVPAILHKGSDDLG